MLWQHVGAARHIWNWMLRLEMDRYKAGEKHLGAYDLQKRITDYKKEPDNMWLNDISSVTLNTVAVDLAEAYKRFFKKQGGHPKFKSKYKNKPSFPVGKKQPGTFYFKSNRAVHIAKLGTVKCRVKKDNFPIGSKGNTFSNVRISYIPAKDKWIVSFGIDDVFEPENHSDETMGIDVGARKMAVAAIGDEKLVFSNPNDDEEIKRLQEDLKFHQKNLSRKTVATKKQNGDRYVVTSNIKKERKKIEKIHYRIANIRKNAMHHATHELMEKYPKRIVIESLTVKDMLDKERLIEMGLDTNRDRKRFRKRIVEANMYEFLRQIDYKSKRYGTELVKADKYYASSKTCSCCGYIKHDLGDAETYECPECGLVIDRDYNAAINLRNYAA